MRVDIGKYKYYVGPYQIAEMLMFWIPKYNDKHEYTKAYDKYVHRFGEILADTPINTLCEWIDTKQKRKIKVKIHDYDTWSMDYTLALIILPMLKKLKETKHGSVIVDLEDVPLQYRYSDDSEYENAQRAFDFYNDEDSVKIECDHHVRWDWVLDEMIFAFEMILNDGNWMDAYKTSYPMTEEESKHQSVLNKLYSKNVKIVYDWDSIEKVENRITNGLILFGKYYRGLWS